MNDDNLKSAAQSFVNLILVLLTYLCSADVAQADDVFSMRLDIQVKKIAIGPEYKYAVATGENVSDDRTVVKTYGLVVVDLKAKKILGSMSLNSPSPKCAIAADRIFLFNAQEKQLEVYDLKTLKRLDLRKYEKPVRFFQASKGRVGILHDGKRHSHDAVTWEEKYVGSVIRNSSLCSIHGYRVSPKHYALMSEVREFDTGQLAMILDKPLLHDLRNFGAFWSISKNQIRMSPPVFGRVEPNEMSTAMLGLVDRQGNKVGAVRGRLSHFHPWSVEAKLDHGDTQIDVSLYASSDASLSHQFSFQNKGLKNRGETRMNWQRMPMIFTPDEIAVANRNRLYFLPTADLEKSEVPVHFPWTSVPVLDAQKISKFSVPAIGGSGDFKYQLQNPERRRSHENDGISVDAGTGELTIDTPSILSQFENSIRQEAIKRKRPVYVNVNCFAPEYQRLTGKELKDDEAAFCLPINIEVVDLKSGLGDKLSFWAIVVATKSKLTIGKKIEDRVARTPNRPAIKPPATKMPSVNSRLTIDQRIARAENLTEKILGKVENIEKLLQQRKNKK